MNPSEAKRPRTSSDTTVLIVDDDRYLCSALTDVLNYYETITVANIAHDADDALIMAKQLQPEVVLLEPQVSGGRGWPTIPEIRKVAPSVAIIVYTTEDLPTTTPAEFLPDAVARKYSTALHVIVSLIRTLPQRKRSPDRTL